MICEGFTEAKIIARLENALRWMPGLQRDIFLAILFGDMAYPESAERSGLSVRQVERRFGRSLTQIVDALNVRRESRLGKPLFRWMTKARSR